VAFIIFERPTPLLVFLTNNLEIYTIIVIAIIPFNLINYFAANNLDNP